jgi:hypothetical protein
MPVGSRHDKAPEVERIIDWIMMHRRLARDYEALTAGSKAMAQIASVHNLLDRAGRLMGGLRAAGPGSTNTAAGGGTANTPDETLLLPKTQPLLLASPPATAWPFSAAQRPCAVTSDSSALPHRTRSRSCRVLDGAT